MQNRVEAESICLSPPLHELAEHYLASRGVKVPEKAESLNDADVELLREVI
ncbi:hypothetical protein HB762_27720 (plasmid) [Vibrio campbellii]|uniref:Uncharacterized protein n=1 Tax=Vibrio campbellii TaxID=680 RepID=A0ABY5IN60_9VIBR|nr:hypothetical protein [Vibrio campbellii]UTZ35055.1 hypothetical protein HB762_27720 [Vibrio campbellii]